MGKCLRQLPLKAKRLLLVIDRHLEEDGGPGSGNWGHKGRPGQVGGSGKGGGKQYRGGRGDIVYTSSKHDWLNGLKGEKQQEAQRWLKSRAEGLKKGEDDKRSAEQMIMQSGSVESRGQMLEFMQEARHWDKLSGRMIRENLDDKDKALVTALTAKYGVEQVGETFLPNEKADMSEEDRACWYDLKSKAMSGETSGQEAPDELQYAAGLKERPKPAGFTWKKAGTENLVFAINGVQRALKRYTPLASVDTKEELDQIETDMFKALYSASDKMSRYDADRGLKQYIKAKYAEMGKFDHDAIPQECLDRLNPQEQKELREALYHSHMRSENPMDWLDYAGPEYRAAMFALFNKAMGGADMTEYVEQQNQELKRKQEEENKRREEEQRKREEEQKRQEEERKKKAQEHKEKALKAHSETKQQRLEKYSKASSAKDVADAMNTGGFFSSSAQSKLSTIDVECARSIAMQYEKVCDRFPFLIGTLGSLTEDERKPSAYACCWTMTGGGVDINPSHFGNVENLRKKYERDVGSRWHPEGTDWNSVVTHELGHAIDGYMSTKGILGSQPFSSTADRFSGILFRKTMRALKKKWTDVPNELSRYGAKNNNHSEWFAECFAEAMNSASPRPMATEMMRQLELVINQEGLNNV